MAKSRYQLGARSKRGKKGKFDDNKPNRTWLKNRRRVRRKILGG